MFRPSPPFPKERLRIVSPSVAVTRVMIGNAFYDYYGFI